jgi:hypothetical protein
MIEIIYSLNDINRIVKFSDIIISEKFIISEKKTKIYLLLVFFLLNCWL